MRIHLDTDLGGDTDDACALAMLLGWPGVEVVGVTTVCDRGGIRAGYVGHCLGLVGRDDIPVAAGAGRRWARCGPPTVERQRLRPVVDGDVLRFAPVADGRPVRVVVDLDGPALGEAFLGAVEAAQASPTSGA